MSIWLMHAFSTIIHRVLCVLQKVHRHICIYILVHCCVTSQHFWQTACHAQPTLYFMISEPTLYSKALLDFVQAGDNIAPQLIDISEDLLPLQFAEVTGKLLARYSKWKVKCDAASHAMLQCMRNIALGHYMQGSEADLDCANQYLTEAWDLCKQMPVRLAGNATNADLVMKIGLVYELANVNFAFVPAK